MQKRILSLFIDEWEFLASSYISYKQKTNRLFLFNQKRTCSFCLFSFKTRDIRKDFLVYRLW